jgi:hypothetical protein
MSFIFFTELILPGSMAAALPGIPLPEKAGWQSSHVTIAKDGTLTYTPDG